MDQPAKRYSGVVRHQFSGKSFAWCPEAQELIRFYTIDVEGLVEEGSIVEFEIEGLDSEGPYYASNVSVKEASVSEINTEKEVAIEGHECSNCGTRWQSPDYSSCPRCGYAPASDVKPTLPQPVIDAMHSLRGLTADSWTALDHLKVLYNALSPYMPRTET